MKKYYILALTFLCLLMGQSSFGQMKGPDGDYVDTCDVCDKRSTDYNAEECLAKTLAAGDYDGSGETWEDENGSLRAKDSEGHEYLDTNGDGTFDHNERTLPADGTASPSGSSSTGSTTTDDSSSGSYSFGGWGGGTSTQTTILPEDDDSSNDVASSDNSMYSSDTSLGVSSNNIIYSEDSSSSDNTIIWDYGTTINLIGTVWPVKTPFTEADIINGLNYLNISNLPRPILYKSLNGNIDYYSNLTYPLTINAVGGAKIALYEQLSLTVYDIDSNTKANTTIGFGHLLHTGPIKTSEINLKITLSEAINLLSKDLIANDKVVSQKIENKGLTGTLNRNQYYALFDLQYNAGSYLNDVLDALKISTQAGIQKLYQNVLDFPRGEQIRRYFEYICFTENRYVSPEEAKMELIQKGIYKY